MYAFLVPSLKRDDLVRDGRYAMHSFPADDNEDAAYLTGTAGRVLEPDTRASLEAQFLGERTLAERPVGFEAQELFEFDIERCLYTRTKGHGDPYPQHTVWSARDR